MTKRKQRLLASLADAVAAYEAAFGEISAAELIDQERRDAGSAVVIRDARPGRKPSAPPNG